MVNLNVQARDSGSQTAKQNAKQPVKEYSKDGKLWVGMTQKEAYQNDELSKLFSFTDANKDKVLDKDEIARYNGPTIIASNCRGESGEFYPGLRLENVSPESQNLFREIDVAPRDSVIQENEIQEYIADRKKSVKTAAIMGGTVGGVMGSIIASGVLGILGKNKGRKMEKELFVLCSGLFIGALSACSAIFKEPRIVTPKK